MALAATPMQKINLKSVKKSFYTRVCKATKVLLTSSSLRVDLCRIRKFTLNNSQRLLKYISSVLKAPL